MLIQILNYNVGKSKENSVVCIILFNLSHHRLYNKSATISFPMAAFTEQEQFALPSSILCLDFESR